MDGVTILNTIEKVYYYPSIENFLMVLKILGITAAIIYFGIATYVIFIGLYCDNWAGHISLVCIGVVLACGLGYSIAKSESQVAVYEQVLVTDSVSMEDFTEKYQIIEQQGITYLVLEKGESE